MLERLPRPDAPPVRLEIDHREVSVPEGTSVLRAAELAGVYVPSLCSHKELSPFGGCRLCSVEIEGARGYPLACNTVATEGMAVTTDTVALREMREEILRLILSEHPCSCLLCGESDDCRRTLTTIRKAGVSTGCRSCPNDGDCELQSLVERLGIDDVGYPITYRGLEAEHDDPFYDRDYNLCILCGRCVRMCHEVRGASVLAFKHRGPRTLIGPAFGLSHVAAGCEFCGACVSVCPTGALAEKVSKWDGKPDGAETSTCPFCCLGCRVELAHKGGALSSVGAAHDVEVNDGQLCVRGRFCLPEVTHHYARVRKPMVRKGPYDRVVTWDEALDVVSAALSGVAPGDVLLAISPDLTNEAIFAAQRFARQGLAGAGVDSTASAFLPGGPAFWSRLFALPASLAGLAEAETVIVAGLDTRFSFSVVGVQVRRAMRRGGRLVAVDARESNLARVADRWVRSAPGDEARALLGVLREVRDEAGAGTLSIVVGPRVFDCPGAGELLPELEAIAARPGVSVLPLAHGANVRGALELGALADVLPGPRPAPGGGPSLATLRGGRPPRVLYLVGETPFSERPDCELVIAQGLYAPPFPVDVFLPAASSVEADGTLTSIEGRVQEQRAVEHGRGVAAGSVHPDWRIFSDLAERLGRPDLRYADDGAVRAAIRGEVAGFPDEADRRPRAMTPLAAASPRRAAVARGAAAARGPAAAPGSDGPAPGAGEGLPGRGRFVLVIEHASFRHRGFDLAGVVEGLGELHLEEGLALHPADLARLGVEAGGELTVGLDGAELVLAARPDPDCPRGAAYLWRDETWQGGWRPVRVGIRAGDRSRRPRPARRAPAPRAAAPAAAKATPAGALKGGDRGRDR
ncbi:MAG TPA: molybdopterin-dependent oxidoreductase [Thermoleophilia bacterium]|nr:molybdopterin-dependent oxidoreductase [Thermoleophilia bacterium]